MLPIAIKGDDVTSGTNAHAGFLQVASKGVLGVNGLTTWAEGKMFILSWAWDKEQIWVTDMIPTFDLLDRNAYTRVHV